MTREEHLEFCLICKKNRFNPKLGVVCSLTNEIAAFEGHCPDFLADEKEVKLAERKKQDEQKDIKKTVNYARYILFFLGVSYVLMGYIEAYVIEYHHIIFGYVDWSIALIFIGLGVLSIYHPRPAMIAGLSIYVLITLLIALFDFSTIFQGVIWKMIVIFGLVYGIQATHKVQQESKGNSEDLLDQ